MSLPINNWRRWRGWLVGITISLLGVGLIISDRVAARSPSRSWITPTKTRYDYYNTAPDPALGEPWPTSISQIVFPEVSFHYTPSGSEFANIVEWIVHNAHIDLDVNWHALAAVGVSGKSTLLFEGTNVPLPDLLDALLKDASAKAANNPRLVWEAQSGRVVYLTTATELEEERRCRAQRQKEAPPPLRKALDRKIPYVKLRDLTIGEALRYCQTVSGVNFLLDDPSFWVTAPTPSERSEIVDVIAKDVTFEQLLESILHRTTGEVPSAWHFTVEGDRLHFFRGGGEE